MAEAEAEANPLLSSIKASDSSPLIQLHPLVLLTISDYVTRHTLRQQQGPIVGAIIGQQNGREITLEHAFECKITSNPTGDVAVDGEWFKDRLQQFKDVHKAPPLDFVGWFTLAPPSGPQSQHLALHSFFMNNYSESSILLAFHPSSILNGSVTGGKLPITIYESTREASSNDGGTKVEVGDESAQNMDFRFRELPYSVETGEAEMISVDFVAKGGGNATLAGAPQAAKVGGKDKGKGKAREGDAQVNGTEEEYLSREEEELISSLTAKANATRMLQARLALIKSYLSSLPPSYLSDLSIPVCAPAPASATDPAAPPRVSINHPLLRNVLALLSRLPLLVRPSSATHASLADPTSAVAPPPSTFTQERIAQSTDVAMTTLLASVTSWLRDAQALGRKFAIVESARASKQKSGLRLASDGLHSDNFEDERGDEFMGSEGGSSAWRGAEMGFAEA